jgi:hypothetical protein
LAAQTQDEIASDAAALGSADGSLADAAGLGSGVQVPGPGPVGGETLGG